MTALVSLQALKRWMDIEDGNDDDNLQRANDAASEWIRNYTGRDFATDPTPSTHTFYPNDDGTVSVVDLLTATSVKVDSHGDRTFATTVAPADYELLPLDGPPYDLLRSWPTSSQTFPAGRLVEIVGTFGYDATGGVPPAVQQACLILAARYYKRAEAPFGILQAVDLGTYSRISERDPDVCALLEPYRAGSASGSTWVVV